MTTATGQAVVTVFDHGDGCDGSFILEPRPDAEDGRETWGCLVCGFLDVRCVLVADGFDLTMDYEGRRLLHTAARATNEQNVGICRTHKGGRAVVMPFVADAGNRIEGRHAFTVTRPASSPA